MLGHGDPRVGQTQSWHGLDYRHSVSTYGFSQVDVFGSKPCDGNPVAVVHLPDGKALTARQMQAFARWTNLSETTFLMPSADPDADYRLRIFTPGGELPFAGHPTLGSAMAWLDGGNEPKQAGMVVQECGAGLIRIRRRRNRLAFAAPPLIRSGEPGADTARRVLHALGASPRSVQAMSWVVNGPRWLGVLMNDPAEVLALRPDLQSLTAIGEIEVGVIARYPPGGPADVEVRAFCPDLGIGEDPVTGSLNAGLACWLIPAGVLPSSYVVAQGRVLGRSGRVHIDSSGEDIWVGGRTDVCVRGEVDLRRA